MTNSSNAKSLNDIIFENNISIDFLKSSLLNGAYHTSEFNFNNLFWKFRFNYNNFFHLLQQSKFDLLTIGYVGVETIGELEYFLSKHNCSIGMFSDFTIDDFYSVTGEKTRIEDLTNDEKTLSLVLINCLVKEHSNDMELGREIRKIFNAVQ